MKLENQSQKVVTLPKFIIRLARYAIFAFVLVLFSVLIGTLGYRFFGELDWIDSFYMECMILTGMKPVSELTTSTAKIFSSFYALFSGIAFLSIMAVFFAPIIHRVLHILHVENDTADS